MKNYKIDIDYRIVDFEKSFKDYLLFNEFLKTRENSNERNEFEVRPIVEEEIIKSIGFRPESLIVCFIPYLTNDKLSVKSNLSLHAMSLDYHILVKNILSTFSSELGLKEEEYYSQCDTGIFNERFFAIYTGLGKRSLNQMVINDIYGSFGFIGLIFSKKKFNEKTTPIQDCFNCKKCIDICPGNAIKADSFSPNQCVGYLTQKKNITNLEKENIKKNGLVYGCDRCQMACPENNGKKYSNIKDFNVNLLYNIKLEDIKVLTNKMFKDSFGNRNFSWRGKSVILRNLEILEREND